MHTHPGYSILFSLIITDFKFASFFEMSWTREENFCSDGREEKCASVSASQIARLLLERKSSDKLCMLCLCGESLLGAEDSVYLGNEHIDTTISVKMLLDILCIIPTKYECKKGMFQKVCVTCVNQLSQFYMFIFKCQKSLHAYKEFELLVLHHTKALHEKLPAKIEIPSDNIYDYAIDYKFVGLLDKAPDEDVKFIVKTEPFDIDPTPVQTQKRENEMLDSHVQETAVNGLSCSICNAHFETADELVPHRKHHQHSNVINHILLRAPLCICCLKTEQNLRCLSDKVSINEMLKDHEALSNYEVTPAILIKNVFNITIQETTDSILICDICIDHVIKAFMFYNALKESIMCVKSLLQVIEESMNRIINNCDDLRPGYIYVDIDKLISAKLRSGSRNKKKNVEELEVFGINRTQKQRKNMCPICHEVSRNYSHLKTHTAEELEKFNITIINADKIECAHCGKTLSKNHINRHIKEAHCGNKVKKKKKSALLAKQLQCDQCNFYTSRRNLLEGHVNKYHLNMRPYLCGICSKGFYTKTLCAVHEQRHAMVKSVLCPHCGKRLSSQRYLKNHMLEQHNQENLPKKSRLHCDHCDYNTPSKAALEGHINKHHLKQRPYPCDICGKSFYTKYRCVEHAQTHVLSKPEMCSQCGKRFGSKKALTFHIRLHTGERPYKCHKCDDSYINASRLQHHIRSKHTDKDTPCPYCLRLFKSVLLRNHIRNVHADRENFVKGEQRK